MCTPTQLRLKRTITADVTPPNDPGMYSGNTNSLKSIYKQELKIYEEYKEHKLNTIKAIQVYSNEDLLINLESDGMFLKITPMQIYEQMWNNFLLPVDKDREILKAKELLKIEYNPDCIIQHNYKTINDAWLLLTALGEIVIDGDVKRNAYTLFEKQVDLKEACWDWNRSAATTWPEMKTYFSTEIQMNLTDPAIMRRKEQANAVLDQTKEQEETQQQA